MCSSDLGPQPLPDIQILLTDLIDLLPKGPDLIRRPGKTGGASRMAHPGLFGYPVPVKPHYGTKGAVFEPADQKLTKLPAGRIAPMEASDIRRPPGNPRNPHMKPRNDLYIQAVKAGINVPGPHTGPISLRSRPGASDQAEDVLDRKSVV